MYGFSSLVACTDCVFFLLFPFPFSLHHLFVCSDYVKKKKCCYIDAYRGKTLTEAALFQKVNKLEKYMYTHSKQGQALLPKKQKN